MSPENEKLELGVEPTEPVEAQGAIALPQDKREPSEPGFDRLPEDVLEGDVTSAGDAPGARPSVVIDFPGKMEGLINQVDDIGGINAAVANDMVNIANELREDAEADLG